MSESKESEGVKRSTSYDSLLYLRAARRIPRSRSVTSFQVRHSPDEIGCTCDILKNGRYYPRWLHKEYNGDQYAWDNYWSGIQTYYGSQYSDQFSYNSYYPSYRYNSFSQMPFSWYISYRPPQFGYPYFGSFTNSSIYGLINKNKYRAAYPYFQWQGKLRSDWLDQPTTGIKLSRMGTLSPDTFGNAYLRSHYLPIRYMPYEYSELQEPVKMLRPHKYSYGSTGWPRPIDYHIQGFYQ